MVFRLRGRARRRRCTSAASGWSAMTCPPPAGRRGRTGRTRPQRYRITGKVGDMAVDLTATPDEQGAPPRRVQRQPRPLTGDPARLARIRAAKMPPITKPVMFDTPRGRRDLLGPGSLPARQPVEPGRRGLAAAPQLEEHHRLDRAATSRCATTPTWASSSCRRTRSGWT